MAKIKAISFLGIANYQYTNYILSSQTATTHKFFGATLTEFFPEIDEIYIVMTKEARSKHWDSPENDNLQKTLANQAIIATPIDIKSGQNEAELWEIFSEIIKNIEPDDRIIFDITNAFRSQPVLVLIMTAFLKIVRNVAVKALVYGAFEAKKSIVLPNGKTTFPNNDPATESPVFDLTPFLTLLDWTTATNTFIQTGRAEQLTKLATSFGNQAIEAFAGQIQTLSQELLTTRPVGVIQAASGFEQALAKVETAVQENPAMQPYQQLLERIKDEYNPFAIVKQPLASLSAAYHQARTDQQGFLRVQIKMIRQYLDKGLPIQAMTLAREWLVSLGAYHQGSQDIFNYKDREIIARMLNKNSWSEDPRPSAILQVHLKQIREVWSGITLDPNDQTEATNHVRNDIAHCGMTPVFIKNGQKQLNVRTAADIINQTTKICDRLEGLLTTIV